MIKNIICVNQIFWVIVKLESLLIFDTIFLCNKVCFSVHIPGYTENEAVKESSQYYIIMFV